MDPCASSSTYLTHLNSWSTCLSPILAYAHLEACLLIQYYILSAMHNAWQCACLLNDEINQFLTWCLAPKSAEMTLVTKRMMKLLKNAKYLRTSEGHSLNEDRVSYGAFHSPRVMQNLWHKHWIILSYIRQTWLNIYYISDTIIDTWILRLQNRVEKDKVSAQGMFTIKQVRAKIISSHTYLLTKCQEGEGHSAVNQ